MSIILLLNYSLYLDWTPRLVTAKYWRPCYSVLFFRIHRCFTVNIYVGHYSDVTMGAMASQITSLTIVYPKVYSGEDQRKHQSSASLAFVRGMHRWPVYSPHKWPVTRIFFPFYDVIIEYMYMCYTLTEFSHLERKTIRMISGSGFGNHIHLLWKNLYDVSHTFAGYSSKIFGNHNSETTKSMGYMQNM